MSVTKRVLLTVVIAAGLGIGLTLLAGLVLDNRPLLSYVALPGITAVQVSAADSGIPFWTQIS